MDQRSRATGPSARRPRRPPSGSTRLPRELERQGRTPEDPRSRLARRTCATWPEACATALAPSTRTWPGSATSRRPCGTSSTRPTKSGRPRWRPSAAGCRGMPPATRRRTRSGDPQVAESDLDRLADRLGDMTAAELSRFGQSLAALQGAASQAGAAADAALRDATNALARGDATGAAEALRRLGEALRTPIPRCRRTGTWRGAASQLQDAPATRWRMPASRAGQRQQGRPAGQRPAGRRRQFGPAGQRPGGRLGPAGR